MTWIKNMVTALVVTLGKVAKEAINQNEKLKEWIKGHAKKHKAKHIEFWIDGKQVGGSGMANETQLHSGNKRDVTLKFVDAQGNEAPIDENTSPKVDSDGKDVMQVIYPSDGDKYLVTIVGVAGKTGDANLFVEADVDLGGGYKPLKDQLLVHVVSPEATAIQFDVGEEEPA